MKATNRDIYNSIKELQVHDHACMIYETKEEQLNLIVPFIKIGLERGEKCIYIVDDNTAQTIIRAMQEDGIDTESAIETGSLNILTKHDLYIKYGHFDPELTIQFLKEAIDSAKAEGYKVLRGAAEMTWFLEEAHANEKLKEYESKLNNFFSEDDILAICQYNSRRISPEVILHSIHTHPTIIHRGLVCKNDYFIPPEEFLRSIQKDIEVSRLLSNITKNKQAEEAFQRSNSLLSSVIESPDNIIIFVLDKNYNYLNFNMAHVRKMKEVYDADIEIGQYVLAYMTVEDDRLKAEENYKRVLKGERFVKIEEYGRANSRVWYELIFNPIYDNLQHVTGFTGFVTDITNRKKMEEAIVQSEKMKSLGIITAGISHEFNNILNIISGKVQLLEMDYNNNSELMGELSTIMKAVDDGVTIADNMLKITTSSDDTSEFVPYDINELLRQSLEFTKPRWKNIAQANGIDYVVDQKGIENVSQLLCHPTEIREVFTNIINNALDAMPDGGSISFCTWSDDDTLFVSISDTGKGMTEEVKIHIFDPFFTTRCPEGTGLGMSMSYGIINRHGGKIEVESEVGKGATFTLQFPTTNKEVCPTSAPEPEQVINIKNLDILVVDDDEEICGILDKFLSRKGHKVKTVDNGADAINIIKAVDFDLVLSDLGMPDVNGYEVARAINKLDKKPKIGIITGWRVGLKRFNEKDAKVDFLLKKPFKHAELVKHINELFGADS